MIKLEGIHKVFHKKKQRIDALNGIDLHIAQGDIFGIIGYSGSGKSTLVRTMNLLERHTQGKLYYKNQEIPQLTENKLMPYRR